MAGVPDAMGRPSDRGNSMYDTALPPGRAMSEDLAAERHRAEVAAGAGRHGRAKPAARRMRRARAVLLCLSLGACGVQGSTDLAPEPADVHAATVSPGPTAALAAPAGWKPAPDLVTPRFAVSAARLFAAVQQVAAAQPRTFLQAAYPERLQAFYVVRSSFLNLPDLVLVQAVADGPGGSTLVMFSHSRWGPWEGGTNLRRLGRWLRQVREALAAG